MTTGIGNTFLGCNAGSSSAHWNVAIGHSSGHYLNTGGANVYVGVHAGSVATSGDENVYIGNYAGYASTTGENNTALGYQTMDALTTGTHNTALGNHSMGSGVVTGIGNNSVGYAALVSLTSGTYNIGLGAYAGSYITSGDNNIIIGKEAGITGSPGGEIGTADNEICLGDENISAANIQVAWSVASDKRDKNDIEPLTLGLEFINQLEPVTYRWDKRTKYINKSYLSLEADDPDFVDLNNVVHDGTHTEPQLHAGLLAQDVEEVEQAYGFDKEDLTALVTNLSGDGKSYSLSYERFVPMLIKAVQELSAEVEELKKESTQ